AVPARAGGERGPAPGLELHALSARPRGRGAAVRQRLREATGHAQPVRAAAVVGARCAHRHAQLVPGLAAGGAPARRNGRSGQGHEARPGAPAHPHAPSRALGHGRPGAAAGVARYAGRLLRRPHGARDRRRGPLGGAPADRRGDRPPAGFPRRLTSWHRGAHEADDNPMTGADTQQTAIRIEGEAEGRTPVVCTIREPVSVVVHEAHERTLTGALERWQSSGLSRDEVEPILTYCAEQRCRADDATCPGCRMRTEKLGLRTFDDFVSRHAEITFEGSDLRLPGAGEGRLEARSLEHLAKTWAGEEYWFWARRVLRKLRHGIRRAGQMGAPPPQGDTPAFVLVRPQLVDNIGM